MILDRKEKVLVGLSGGVDSSVTAALLLEQGYEVEGITMTIWDGVTGLRTLDDLRDKSASYGPDESEDVESARRIAAGLGIAFHTFTVRDRYESVVLDHFRDEYSHGRTPNPCILCNAKIKFGALLETAQKSGVEFDYFATGHYARILPPDETSAHYRLCRARDEHKDQTYFLHLLTQQQLSSIRFPLGELTKGEVRKHARRLGLHTHDKKDSKGFYAGDYRDILGFGEKKGDIIDEQGNHLGTHNGIWNFTIGQRKGLGLGPGKAYFVKELDSRSNTVVVGGKDSLLHGAIDISDVHWIGAIPQTPFGCEVKVGNTHPVVYARVEPLNSRNSTATSNDSSFLLRAHFEEPRIAIATGQAAVLYMDDCVVGGGVIQSVYAAEMVEDN